MEIVSSRDFRAHMGKYMSKAVHEDVIIKSRSYGTFKLVPVSDDDTLFSKEEFFAKIDRSLAEIRAGKFYTMMPGESLDEFLARIEKEKQDKEG